MVKNAPFSTRVSLAVLMAAASCLSLTISAIAAAPAPTSAPAPAAPPTNAAPPPAADPAVDQEAARLREALREAVPHLISDTPQTEQAWVELTQAGIGTAGSRIER